METLLLLGTILKTLILLIGLVMIIRSLYKGFTNEDSKEFGQAAKYFLLVIVAVILIAVWEFVLVL